MVTEREEEKKKKEKEREKEKKGERDRKRKRRKEHFYESEYNHRLVGNLNSAGQFHFLS